ncbi:TMEM175 family protein [Okibacterium endophyticum]
MATIPTERGLDRLVNFSDASVAIAITILLLPLVDVAQDINQVSLGELLDENSGTLIAFAFTFAVIARLWTAHHRLLESAGSYDHRIVWVNFVWLASMVFMPFTGNLLAHADFGDRGVNALYIGTVFVSSASLFVLRLILVRSPHLRAGSDDSDDLLILDGALPAGVLLLALVLGVLMPDIGVLWLLLLIIAGIARRLIVRRRSSR